MDFTDPADAVRIGCVMARLEPVALELLEYKVEALERRQPVRGGLVDLWELRRVIDEGLASLGTDDRARFAAVSRRLNALAMLQPHNSPSTVATLDALRLDDGSEIEGDGILDTDASAVELSRDEREEQQVLQRLAERVWRDEIDEAMARFGAAWRAERDRLTPRLIYTTLRNLRRHAEQRDTVLDATLRGFRVVEPLAEPDDALVSLSDLDSLAEIGRDLVQLILTLGGPDSPLPRLEVPEAQALPFAREAMTIVAKDPYAGKLTPIVRRGPSTKELRTAMQEVGKERLPEAQRAALRRDIEARLSEALAFERQSRATFQRDVARNLEAVQALFERLARMLPARVGGSAPPPRLGGGVLLGVLPALRWERVPHDADTLTLNMSSPVRFTLGGHEVAVMGTGESRTLFVDERPHPLSRRATIQVGRGELRVDREGDYLHLRWDDGGRDLATRLAEALVQSYVLSHDRHTTLVEVLAFVAGVAGGVDEGVVGRAVARAGAVTSRAPNRRVAVEGLLQGAAAAAGTSLDEHLMHGVVQRILTALSADPGDLTGLFEREDDAEGAVHTLSDEPTTADLGTLKLTVRRYRPRSKAGREQVVVMLPGRVVGSFTETMVESVPGGVLVAARGEDDVALVFLRGRALRGRRS